MEKVLKIINYYRYIGPPWGITSISRSNAKLSKLLKKLYADDWNWELVKKHQKELLDLQLEIYKKAKKIVEQYESL